ncbi:MAG: D-alanyl-D-alanine carboxypeptidase [Clostridia bacterium]|nr:D-alanyl-D-alanine carboxypeptidase [Clostridia bacterium]
MKLKDAILKKISIKLIFCLLLTGITISYIISAYTSMAKEKHSVDLPELQLSEKDVTTRLNKLITYSIGNKNQDNTHISPPELSAAKSIVTDINAGRILYEKNAYSKAPMASTTKIMTFIVSVENCEDIYETVTVSQAAAYTEGSTMHLAEGETITVHDLLYGLMLNSGNDAAVALAEHIGGSVEDFCNMMNDRASEIGASNTQFKTPHGLDRENHYTTAYDLALIAKEAYKQPLFRKIIATSSIYLNGHNLKNTNPLLGKYSEVTGGKTGYTSGAGRCIVFFIETDGIQAVVVLLNCPSSNNRISDGRKLIKYISQNFRTFKVFERGMRIDYFSVEKGRSDDVYGIIDKDIYITLANWEKADITASYHRETNQLTAPVKYSDKLGSIYINWGSEMIVDVTAEHSVVRKTYTDHLGDMIKSLPYVFD